MLHNKALQRNVIHVAVPCSQWIARSPGRNGNCARPLSYIVRHLENRGVK
jgi:hypothetical protein